MRFQSTLPAGGATDKNNEKNLRTNRFQSTLPAGGATTGKQMTRHRRYDFNPRSPRGERLYMCNTYNCASIISIHAPRGGSDFDFYWPALANIGISIHAPRGGSDTPNVSPLSIPFRFQSTLPAGGATSRPPFTVKSSGYFNPRSPRGERPGRL